MLSERAPTNNGNLYVATYSSRVVRFPAPFTGQTQVLELPTWYWAETSFTGTPITDPSAVNMFAPYGLAFTGTNGLMVSDIVDNRVLYIPFSSGQTTFEGRARQGRHQGVLGFCDDLRDRPSNKLNSPHHIAADTNGQVYVTDTSNWSRNVLLIPTILKVDGASLG